MATKSKPADLVAAVDARDRRLSLEALSHKLAVAVSSAEPHHQAALSKELRAVLAELESLPGGEELSPFDEIANRRAARLSAANQSGAALGGRRTSKRDA